jgi:DNA repair exonuclease SbcCD ATPase subunit
MILKRVTLTNFRSYKGTHTFSPKEGTYFVLGENEDAGYSGNGGGKTSLLASIAWALYGELATGASKDAIIHYGEPIASVEVSFEGLVVRRSKRKSKAEELEFFLEEDGCWVREDLSETQAKLDKYLGVGKELFYNAFWLDNASKAVQFLFKRPAERLTILQELLGEGFFAMAKKAATAKRSQCEKDIETSKLIVSRNYRNIEAYRSRIAGWELDLMTCQEQLERSKTERETKASKAKEELALCQEAYEKKQAERAQFSRVYYFEDAVRTCSLIEAQIAQQEAKFDTPEDSSLCPTCKRPFNEKDRESFTEERSKAYREIARLRLLLDTETKKKDKAKKEQARLDKIGIEINELRVTMKVLERRLEDLDKESSESLLLSIDTLKRNIKKDRDSLAGITGENEEQMGLIEKLSDLIPKYRFWEDGFGSKGIQNLLLDDVRGLLDQFTRHYLSQFSGEVLKVVYPKSDKGFEILMSYRDRETPVSNLSRGEVGRANMAVLLALRKMLLFMHKSKVDFIVLDDAISDLDEAGTQSIVELSQSLSREIGHVFVTIPQPVSSIKPESIVRVAKKEGVSCLV